MRTLSEITKVKNEIAAMTDNNDHCGAVVKLAQLVDVKELIEEAEGIQEQNERIGHMPYELITQRLKLKQNLLNKLHFQYGLYIQLYINQSF